MTDTMTSQNIDLTSWDILYINKISEAYYDVILLQCAIKCDVLGFVCRWSVRRDV
jgi:hypothetical protein